MSIVDKQTIKTLQDTIHNLIMRHGEEVTRNAEMYLQMMANHEAYMKQGEQHALALSRIEAAEAFILSICEPNSEEYKRLWEPIKSNYDRWQSTIRAMDVK